MNRALKTILGIILIAGQAYCIPAHADNAVGAKNAEMLMTNEISLEQDTHEFVAKNHIVPGVAIYAENFGLDEVNRLAKDGVVIGKNCADRYIDLVSGNVLLIPDKDIVVGTNKGKVSIANGATVFVSASKHTLVIYDLMQTKPKEVSVSIGKQIVVIEPGRMLTITDKNIRTFEKLDIDCHCVTYRNAIPVNLSNASFKAFMAEFSIAYALISIQPLQRLTVSENEQDKLTLQKMLKGAIVLGEFAMSTDPPAEIADLQTLAKANTPSDIKFSEGAK